MALSLKGGPVRSRRDCLRAAGSLAGMGALGAWGAAGAAGAVSALAQAADADAAHRAQPWRLAACWRGAAEDSPQHVGVIVLDPASKAARIERSAVMPTRSHGMAVLADGSIVTTGVRPGRWIMRLRPDGSTQVRRTGEEPGSFVQNGHVQVSADGTHLFTTETDARSGMGSIAVRDLQSLDAIRRWETGGIEPHHLLVDGERLWVAHGGIRRGANDRKVDLDRMDSSLACFDARDGRLLGRWRVADPRMSLRHLALGRDEHGERIVGIAMQAEHEERAVRESSPILAVWHGGGSGSIGGNSDSALQIVAASRAGQGYGGDIASAPGGGFAFTNHRLRRAWVWRPGVDAVEPIAELEEAYAIAGDEHRVAVAAARGSGVWNDDAPAQGWRWPEPMAMDNHWVPMA